MPLYDVKCQACGKQAEIFRSLNEYEDLPECCGQAMQRIISAPMVMNDIQPYISQIDGSVINSRSAHKAHLKTHRCEEVGNETSYLKSKAPAPPPGLKETLIEVVNSKM